MSGSANASLIVNGSFETGTTNPASGGFSTLASAVPVPQVLQSAKLARKLSPADQRLADEQRVCPVTGLPLNSMGGPIAVEVAGRRVFLCCKGCEGALRADPQKYFAKLKASP